MTMTIGSVSLLKSVYRVRITYPLRGDVPRAARSLRRVH